MPSIIIVEKIGSLKVLNIKSSNEDELYKKAGFKTIDGFKCHTTWTLEYNKKIYNISLFGKTNGRANQENKYEFPPPIDKLLFFGNCLLINKENNKVSDISIKEWENIYEKLYGGFDDMNNSDEDEDEEDENDDDDDDVPKTKSGYKKDGFVVDDDDSNEDEEDDDDYDEDDEDDELPKEKTKNSKNKKTTANKKKLELLKPKDEDEEQELFLDCTSELSEESYIGDV